MIILASTSRARKEILTKAGLVFEAVASGVDEDAAKRSLLSDGQTPRAISDALAELKAVRVSMKRKGLVFGSDQTLDLNGQLFDKAATVEELAKHLQLLRGRKHQLHSAVVAAEDGVPVWRALTTATLTVRTFSEAWLSEYLSQCGHDVLSSVGGYHYEGLGAQLFERVEGDVFTILGLPLLPMLAYLRERGLMTE